MECVDYEYGHYAYIQGSVRWLNELRITVIGKYEIGTWSTLLAVKDAQPFNWKKRQRNQSFTAGANTPTSFISGMQFGWSLDWHRLWVYCLIQLQAAYSFVILATSQIWSCNVHLHMLICKLYSFVSSTAQWVLFALGTFQVSGKQIHDHDIENCIEVPAALF